MESLTLGVLGLPEAESRLIATLFRLHGVESSFIWTLRTAPPYDALLVDASLPASEFRPFCGSRTVVMPLSPPGQVIEGQMQRPIRSDRLLSWLNVIEIELLHDSADGFASTLRLSEAEDKAAEASSPSAPSPPSGAADNPLFEARDIRMTLKLKRWPPAQLLGKHPGKIRLATILARKPIALAELVAVSRVEGDACAAFVRTLNEHDLLLIELRPAPVTETAQLDPVQREQASPKKESGAMALIRSIRRVFNLH